MNRRAVDSARLARAVWLAALLAAAPLASAQTDPGAVYDAPVGFYDASAGLTGAALQEALRVRTSSGHVVTSYTQARDYLAITDADPANSRYMFNVYDRGRPIDKGYATKQGFVGLYQSREHVWPDSRQSGSANGDVHMLKPSDAPGGLNELRGSLFYGGANLTGAARQVTSTSPTTFFAGDADIGDVARITMYGATRWSGDGLRLIDGFDGTGNQMGDKQTILRWHYRDAPDLFERRRNDVIFRGDDIRTAGDDFTSAEGTWDGSKNRNPFIDRPEYAWSVFQNQNNDTKLKFGATANADGSSTATVNLGRVLRNASVPAAQTITLNKTGAAGTYYSVTAAGDATSSVGGRLNAFAMDADGSRQITVGLNTTTAAAGLKSGTVTVDNLDVTTGLGAGFGAGDANDVANVQLSVLDASNSTFSASADVDALTLDFGTVRQGEVTAEKSFAIFDRASILGAALTAALDLDSIAATGATSRFSTTLALFANLAAGDVGQAFAASFDTSTLGQHTAVYTLGLSDENLPGTVTTSSLQLTLTGTVIAVPEPVSVSLASLLLVAFARRRRKVG